MGIAIAVWSAVLEPGKKTLVDVPCDVHITNAALGDSLQDENARTSVKLTYSKTPQDDDSDYDDEEPPRIAETDTTVLCSLTPAKIEHATLDLIIEQGEEYEFEVVGKNTIYLTGNYIDQAPVHPFSDNDDVDSEDYESDHDLREVSSDVEIDPEELDIPDVGDSDQDEKPPRKLDPKKRRASAMDVEEEKPSKKDEKPSKKLKKEKALQKSDAPKENGDIKEKKEKTGKTDDSSKKSGGDKVELPSGLAYKDVKEGSGKAAKKGDTVSMRYIGKFLDGKVFDQNTKGKPFVFRIGAGEVIKGWDEGIAGMKSGGERLLIVPPKLGYGNRKIDGIPGGSTLRFEVKLLEIK